MKFIYNNKEYTWDEWHDEKRCFVDSLELPNDLNENMATSHFSVIHDIGYTIAMNKYTELYHLIASARTALLKSFDKSYESNEIKWGSDYKAHIWMRGEYLKNSIVWYNSCEDYIYQYIWFAFDMNKDKIDSPEKFEKLLKKVNIKGIEEKLEEKDDDNCNELLSYINCYRGHPDIKYMRNLLANSLKHRGNITFNGLNSPSIIGYKKLGEENKTNFSSDWIQPRIVDIDETIELMSEVHNHLIKFARDVKEFISFEDMFIKNEEGVKEFNKIQDKKVIKK